MRFLIKSPAKIILFGEHFVVYNQKGIVAAIKPYNEFEVLFQKSKFPSFEYYSNIKKYCFKINKKNKKSKHFLLKLYKFFLKKYPKLKSFKITFRVKRIWPIKGVGNSSSISGALAVAIEKFLKNRLSKKKIYQYIQIGDRAAHKKPSGIDATAITNGGLVEFSKNKNAKIIKFKKSNKYKFLIIDTSFIDKTFSSTANQIKKFARAEGRKNIKEYQRIYQKAKRALKNADLNSLVEAMKKNQKLLELGNVSTKTIAKLISILFQRGIEGVKITGAGGKGGAVIALITKNIEEIKKYLKKNGFNCFEFEISKEGIIEKN
ncbi:MAG: mevalonate kinase [Candidatus Omnitrophica bacterium]|nr:mevalonate kinase [Candidatus Omnitrophota bacterium]